MASTHPTRTTHTDVHFLYVLFVFRVSRTICEFSLSYSSETVSQENLKKLAWCLRAVTFLVSPETSSSSSSLSGNYTTGPQLELEERERDTSRDGCMPIRQRLLAPTVSIRAQWAPSSPLGSNLGPPG